MCLYPKLIRNKKYTANMKNGGVTPAILDKRVLAVPIGCGECMECRKKKAREWQIRLSEEIKHDKKGIFVTLTYSDEAYKRYAEKSKLKGYDKDNDVATMATRQFLERWRKKYKKSVKHWLITELGHNGTQNIHMHGIIWTEKEPNEIRRIWNNGFVWLGNEKTNGQIENYVSERTINYIIKYVSKTDDNHKGYKSKILCSKGIGFGYTNRSDIKRNKYKEKETNECYTFSNGRKSALPIYYRNKIYTDEEREKLWINKLDQKVRYVGGQKIDISEDEEDYYKARNWHRERNKRLGYGNGEITVNDKEYEEQRRELLSNKRIERANAHLAASDASHSPETEHKLLTKAKEEGWQDDATERWDREY